MGSRDRVSIKVNFYPMNKRFQSQRTLRGMIIAQHNLITRPGSYLASKFRKSWKKELFLNNRNDLLSYEDPGSLNLHFNLNTYNSRAHKKIRKEL